MYEIFLEEKGYKYEKPFFCLFLMLVSNSIYFASNIKGTQQMGSVFNCMNITSQKIYLANNRLQLLSNSQGNP